MSEFTRVRDKRTGHEYSTGRVDPDHHVVLEKEKATNANGKPLPAKVAEPKSLDDMKVEELKAYAETNQIDLGGVRSKADMIAAIQGTENKEG